jgi:O-antigen/teichoic acid export membrane protein
MNTKKIKSLLGNAAIAGLILSACSAFFTYFKTWILSSNFSSSEFGFFIYITTIIGWLITITTSGLNNGLLGYLVSSNNRSSQKTVAGIVLALSFRRGLMGVFAAAVVFITLLSPLSRSSSFLYFSIALLIPISVTTYLLNSILIHQGKVTLNSAINTFVLNGFSVILLIIFSFIGLNYYWLAVSITLPSILAYILLIKASKCVPVFRATNGYELDVKSVISRSNHMLASGLLYAFWIKAESFFLNNGCGASCVAHFYIPFQFAFLLTVVNTVLYGLVSSRLAHNPRTVDKDEALYNHASIFGYFTNFTIFMFIYINSNELLSLFGSEYNTTNGVTTIRLLSAAFLVYSYFGATAEIYLNMLGKHKYLFMSAAFTAVVSLITNIIITLNYGSLGAACSFTVTILATCWIRNYFVKKFLGIYLNNSYRILAYTITSSLIMELFLIVLNKLGYFQKIIIGNSLLFILISIFIFIYQNNVRENLKFVGMIKNPKV